MNKNDDKPLFYTVDDVGLNNDDYLKKLSFPGMFPFARGVYTSMYRGRTWTMRQYSGFGNAEQTNQRYQYLLKKGQTGLSVAFDLPTQMGYDSDDEISEGEVGKVGVAIDTINDMNILFDNIPLDKVSVSMTINSTAAILLGMYVALAEKRNIPKEKLTGTIQNDILKEYVARGTYIFPPKPSIKIVVDLFEYCSQSLPKWNSISISGYHIREAGSTAAQELGFTLANAITYVSEAINKGLDVDKFAKRLSFFFNCHNNFFEEIAKFRAARRMWANIMKNKFNAKDPKSMMLRFHTQTAGCSLTAQQPYNNITRVAFQALAAALGGTQSLHTNSYDEALSLPTDKAVKLALRTQQLLAFETSAADTIDPLAGSYLVESLTNQIEKEAYSYIDFISENYKDSVGAIESGYMKAEIEKSAYDYQKAIEQNKIKIIGVNLFDESENENISLLKVNPKVAKQQINKLKKYKKNRNQQELHKSLAQLKANAKSENKNIVPYIINCVKNNATLGEISNALREVFGTFKNNER